MALAVAIPAQAGLWCKNSNGESLAWKIGDQRPANMAAFGNAENVVCMVNAQIYRDIAAGALGLRDFPVQANTPSSLVAGPEGAGAIYRGNWARWLIDNLPSSYGAYADWAYFEAIQP
ncbi:MAG: hypothetical protein IPH55_19710 [Betaproteobacteria bacterium]|nr:hypothetical protein [Betaproteobacteria bacterium]